MNPLVLLLTGISGIAFASTTPQPQPAPEGLASADWAGIRSAHESARHAAQLQQDGKLSARNPGQQWQTEFDGKGFTVSPDHGAWTWGLELTGYGDRTVPAPAKLSQTGNKIISQRDENLTEWFINDTRGLEQGWDIRKRPDRSNATAPLHLHLRTRGSVSAQVSEQGDSVSFHLEDGATALSYGGLKAWDATGMKLAVRFEQAGGKDIRISVDDRSARYPITIDPIAQQAFMRASNAGSSDYFGRAVAVSGDTVVIGASNEDSAATGVNGDQASEAAMDSGAVYIFVRTGSTWTQQAYLKASNTDAEDQFGSTVAIHGDTIVVGAAWEDSAATGVNGNQADNSASFAGAAYVFTRSGTTWSQQAYLKASNTQAEDNFGTAVAISGDTILVGAPGEDSNATGVNGNQTDNSASVAGAVYVFTRTGTDWTQQAYLKASNAEGGDYFGNAVAISGDTLVVGAAYEDSSSPGVNGDQSNNSGAYAGAAYVFVRSGTTWSQQAYLKASNPSTSDTWWQGYEFGFSVAVSGDTVIVGSPAEDGSNTGVNSTPSGYLNSAGAAYIFGRDGTTWSQQAYLKAHNSAYGMYFGRSVAASGDKVLVSGKPTSNGAEYPAGYVFKRDGTSWSPLAFLPSNGAGGHRISVGISGETVVVGAETVHYGVHGVTRIQDPTQGYVSQAGAAFVTQLDVPVAPPAITVAVSGGAVVPKGSTVACGPLVVDTSREITIQITNPGTPAYVPPPGPLSLTGSPAVAVSGDASFTVSAQPSSDPITAGQNTSFKVLFAPTTEGAKTATLSIPNNNVDGADPFIIQLTGRALSFTTDTDGDGLNDASEYNMATLNFNWELSQPALASAYLAQVARTPLYTAAEIQALHPGESFVARDPVSHRFKLTTRWKKSTNLADFVDFPLPSGSSPVITPSGGVEFQFASPEAKAFFMFETD